MKKILAVFDGVNYSDQTASFGIELAQKTDSLLVGVFLHDLSYSRFVYAYAWDIPTQYYYGFQEIEKEDNVKITENMKVFTRQCEEKRVKHKIHLDSGVPLQELLKESAFTDLLLIDNKTSFMRIGDRSPSLFLKDLLAESKCPVLILPDEKPSINRVVIAYDGSDSSVFAMKMYSYLFPQWNDIPTNVVTVNHSTSNHVPKNRDIKDLASEHFKNLTFTVLNGEPEEELKKFLKKDGNDVLVVLGAYGRSALSRMFHSSISNRILTEVKVPLFIAHQ
ncbi:MAG: universal stress protein [Chitinophagaceae bacterium]|nr:universal stress protein [Chitinophagaceae bacterium]